MKFGVIVFPGSNCDEDMVHALEHSTGSEVVKLWHKEADLKSCDFIIVPGGFSYGDYLRTGAIARFSPVMDKVVDHAEKGGYVFGVCNGFQILTEAGLLPGVLLRNDNMKFTCKNVYLKPESKSSIITSKLDRSKAYMIPIAHGEGKYYANEDTIKELEKNDNILFRYCNEYGIVDSASNPNGSCNNIAGVSNNRKNVFGMMPHPERAANAILGNEDGKAIFQSLLAEVLA
ncbi:MAG: phosphoribosylformylglycinamidine synthase subunit PurQ [Opitutaceae bacterium]|nr:phosphoribosylformylglycinamidine synthase subunit PurQ [Cytophagales bacterium]